MLNRKRVWILALLHALLFALVFPPFDLWALAFIAPLPLVLLATSHDSNRRDGVIVFLSQFAMWLWLVRWIVPVTAVGYPFLALYMSVWPTLFVIVLRRIAQSPRFASTPLTVLVPIVWVGVEFFRGDVLFNGYPWYLLGHPLIALLPFVQSADLFGTYFISFLVAMVAGAIADVMRSRTGTQPVASNTPIVPIAACVFIFAANIAYGIWRMSQTDSLTAGPQILAIQTNLPQSNKIEWSDEQKQRDVTGFMALTRRAIEHASVRPDLVVWPETMVPGTGFEAQTIAKLREMFDEHGWDLSHLYRWPLAIQQFQRDLGVPMIVGSEAWIETNAILEGSKIRLEPKRTYNSAYLLDGESHQRYDKYFLTPFGETMPYISAWPWLENLFLRIGVGADLSFNLDSNPDVALLKLKFGETNKVLIATPICFEDTVARYCRRMIYEGGCKQGDLFVNISNDGWFTFSIADRKLHAQIARFRCIENRVPMVRSVNTGLSTWIDSAGRIRAAAAGGGYGASHEEAWLEAAVQLDSRHAIYGRIGETWPIICLMASLGMLGLALARKSNAASNRTVH